MKILKFMMTLLIIFTIIPINLVSAEEDDDNDEDDEENSCGMEVEVTQSAGNYYFNDVLIVNKVYPLSDSYNPGADATMKGSFDDLVDSASDDGHDIGITGDASAYGFRSYSTQETLYNDYVDRDGEEEANKYSAKPGHSEHQTGLTLDVKDNNNPDTDLQESFGDTDAGKWVADNAHNYGFVVRYLEGKEDIHGYIYEPWHLRYVGTDLAEELKDKEITLEEYFDIADDSEPRDEGTYTTDNCDDDSNSSSGSSGSENNESGEYGSGRGEYTGNLEYDPFEDEGVVQNSTGVKDGNEGTIHSQETYVASQWIQVLVDIILIALIVILALYLVLIAIVVLLISFTNTYISNNKAVRFLVGGAFVDKMVGNGVKSVFWDILLRFMIGSFVLVVAITGMVNGLQYILIDAVRTALEFIGL